MGDDRLYFRQLLCGRDLARGDAMAAQMVNFVYLIGDREGRECLAVDPAWSIGEILEVADSDGMRVTGVLATHFHPDHVGGDLLGMAMVEGVRELLERQSVKVHCQGEEAPWIREVTGLGDGDLVPHQGGDLVRAGEVEVRLIHTPGHTPGSQCFLVGNRLVSGDTLFLEGCGRTDLPGGSSDEIYRSLHERLARIPDDTVLYPGHLYSRDPSATLGETRRRNHVFRVRSLEDWRRFMGG
ncbi:MAG: MBL fold metallo-hydrolase [Planctomycetes bacterium]|nr:MBL fold metallo-hydrolase [Planctomycetota bacterium]